MMRPALHLDWAVGLALCGGICSCEWLAPLDPIASDASSHIEMPTLCGTLEPSKIKSASPSSSPDWRVVLVRLPALSGALYMDETEVTVGEYQPWADEKGTSFADWNAGCPLKAPGPSNPARTPTDACAASIPVTQIDPFASDKPVRCVDWCDAEAFCRTARSGRLCYRTVGGGASQPENKQDEWPSACNNGSTTVWPWGNEQNGERCNLDQSQACSANGFSCGPAPVRSYAACRNATGIFDLIGNVAEWLETCSVPSNQESGCHVVGGSYDDLLDNLNCGYVGSHPRYSASPKVGFRCCYDLTPAERQACGLP